MAEKDITEKLLEDYNDVFSDIVNNLIFHGQTVVHDDELENSKDKSQYKADDTMIHEQERDVSKFWKKFNIRIAFIGLENQTEIEKFMPVRVIGYDGASYRSQMLNNNKTIYPVITLVLYFGMKRWSKYRKLSDICNIPEELKPYFNDYHINVFEIAYLTDEQVAGFKSDFRIVADYFVQVRKNKNYVPSNTTIKHVDEVLKMMAVLTGTRNFEKAINDKNEAGGKTMDSYLKKFEEDAETRGKVKAYNEMGISISEIAERCCLTEEKVKEILDA